LLNGADGVLVSGCHPRDCHYAQGNFHARRRLEVLKRFLPVLGIDDARFEYTWVSASEGQRWQKVVKTFTERIHALGRAPRLEDYRNLSGDSLLGGERRFGESLPGNGEDLRPEKYAPDQTEASKPERGGSDLLSHSRGGPVLVAGRGRYHTGVEGSKGRDISAEGVSKEELHSGVFSLQDCLDFAENGGGKSSLTELKQALKIHLPNLDLIIGWGRGYDPLHATPLFMRTPEDVDKLVWGPLNVHNLATYLPALRNKKVGVVVKGCDSRSIVELLQENLIERENVMIFSMPCTGVVDLARIGRILRDKGASIGRVEAFTVSGKTLTVTADGQSHDMSMDEAAADKCLNCQYPRALLADVIIGEPSEPKAPDEGRISGLTDAASVDAATQEEPAGNSSGGMSGISSGGMPLSDSDKGPNIQEVGRPEDWMAFWRFHMERCIRCYACRNACPLCVCRDHCIAGSRDPQWVSQEHTVGEKLMFQAIHAMHLAGRCTECGECQRACPMGIPVLELKRHMNAIIRELFDYHAGTSPEAVPPLLSFQAEETNIMERNF
ncbi:MAG: hydrogenase iron-sulfur subunit, partial [Syntrophobacter sp.]